MDGVREAIVMNLYKPSYLQNNTNILLKTIITFHIYGIS